jgi:hypothetical protein
MDGRRRRQGKISQPAVGRWRARGACYATPSFFCRFDDDVVY